MDALIESLSTIATLAAFAVFLWGSIEGVIEYFVKPLLEWPVDPEERRAVILREVSLVVGVVAALLFGIDFLTVLALNVGAAPVHPLVGIIFSGIFMARGSNWLHDRLANPFAAITLEPVLSVSDDDTRSRQE